MADNNKLILLQILKIMKKTDEYHPLNTTQIQRRLKSEFGVDPLPDRKTITRDIECLEDADYSIMRHENHNKGYYMTDQPFEDYELKLLADMVNAAPFLTVIDSSGLVKKLLSLSTHEGESLIKATTLIDACKKSSDNANKYKLDAVTRAIKNKRKICFQYYEIGKDNTPVLKCDLTTGEPKYYSVSPYYLILNQNEYFLIANPDSHDHLTHFRLSMLANWHETKDPIRNPGEIIEHGETFDLAEYIRHSVNMWTGELVTVQLRCENKLRGEILTRFGKDVHFQADGETHFLIYVKVTNNEGFYHWLMGCGANVEVLEPADVRDRIKDYINCIMKIYNPES